MDRATRSDHDLDTQRPAAVDQAHEGPARARGVEQAGDAAIRRMIGGDATAVATRFYAAFAARDAATMKSCYAANVAFHDPLFGALHGSQVMLMWSSIMPKANPFQISPGTPVATAQRPDGAWEVRVHWDASYGLGAAHIDNHSDTTLVIKDGLIVEQRDAWNLDAWTRQALPAHLGGHVVTDLLTRAAAHAYIEVVDLIRRARADR